MSDFKKYIKLLESSERLDESFKVATDKFSEVADLPEVKEYIETFKSLTKRNIIRDPSEKDISKWIKAGWEEFKEFVDSKREDVSNKDIKKKRVNRSSDSITIHESNESKIILPLTEESSCHLGKGTTWCTATVSSKNQLYVYHTLGRFPVYIYYDSDHTSLMSIVYDLYNDNGRNFIEIRDEDNQEMTIDQVIKIIGNNVYDLVLERLKSMKSVLTQLSSKHKLHNASTAMAYAIRTEKRFVEGEPLIATEFLPGLFYVKLVLKYMRFEAWEPVLIEAIKTKEYLTINDFDDDQGSRIATMKNYLKFNFDDGDEKLPDDSWVSIIGTLNKRLAFDIMLAQNIKLNTEDELALLQPNETPPNSVILDFTGYGAVSHTFAYLSTLIRKDPEHTKEILESLKGDIKDKRRYQFIKGYILDTREVDSDFIKMLIETWGIDGDTVYDILQKREDGHLIFNIIDINNFSDKSKEILLNVNDGVAQYINKD